MCCSSNRAGFDSGFLAWKACASARRRRDGQKRSQLGLRMPPLVTSDLYEGSLWRLDLTTPSTQVARHVGDESAGQVEGSSGQ